MLLSRDPSSRQLIPSRRRACVRLRIHARRVLGDREALDGPIYPPKATQPLGDAELPEGCLASDRFYQVIHSRAPRGQIKDAAILDARATIEGLLDLLERTPVLEPWIIGEKFSLARSRSHRACSGLAHWQRMSSALPGGTRKSRTGITGYLRGPRFRPW
jgi:hypothetical protein